MRPRRETSRMARSRPLSCSQLVGTQPTPGRCPVTKLMGLLANQPENVRRLVEPRPPFIGLGRRREPADEESGALPRLNVTGRHEAIVRLNHRELADVMFGRRTVESREGRLSARAIRPHPQDAESPCTIWSVSVSDRDASMLNTHINLKPLRTSDWTARRGSRSPTLGAASLMSQLTTPVRGVASRACVFRHGVLFVEAMTADTYRDAHTRQPP